MSLSKKLACAAAVALHAAAAGATEIVYTPVNPSFGGNPLNGPVLLGIAGAVNKYKDPEQTDPFSRFNSPSALDLFNQRLQSLVLDRIASSITGSIFDGSGNLKPGTIETGSFVINITDQGGGLLLITTTDKTTGASTSFQVSSGSAAP
jgi:curli production assembly/transport component CsgF